MPEDSAKSPLATEQEDTITVKARVAKEFEVEIPVNTLGEPSTPRAELRSRAEDWFWNFAQQHVAANRPTVDDLHVSSVLVPSERDGERRCTECGEPVGDVCYELWLFHTCRDCYEEVVDDA